MGDENCLYLNIYTRANSCSSEERLPVVVWVHGGGFQYGSGCDKEYGPEYAMNEEIVLVTVNYRLGVFGFLATEDGVIPGNLGIKDQGMTGSVRTKSWLVELGGQKGSHITEIFIPHLYKARCG